MAEEENKDNQYVVLARKYRPQNFEDLLGQDALVQTLTNAIKNNRLHHAYILTGIRGVGKTTTARLIAKALNCTGLDGKGGPTIHPCGVCENCKAIAAGRHIDVMELDAASRTGVDDIREILDGVRYKPTNARYKIYIIDEVHMLSKNAFNALLKTLEEPPAHVKFIFATTEIRKVPVTVLSRCQRFDLQRLTIEDLTKLFNKIVAAENLKAEDEALHMIAKAADGSARDGLSLLDQAISLGAGVVKTDIVKEMIGLADRSQTFELFEKLVLGDTKETIIKLQEQYKNGANPTTLLQDLINITHLLAKTKLVPSFVNDPSLSEAEKELCQRLGAKVSIAVLSKMWQMMIKGLGELQVAPVQIDALEMILIRIAYSASLPTPYELLNDVKKNSNLSLSRPAATATSAPAPVFRAAPAAEPDSELSDTPKFQAFDRLTDLVNYLEQKKMPLAEYALKNDVSVSEFSNGFIKMTVSEKIHPDFILNLHKILTEATGLTWKIELSRGALGVTLADLERAAEEEEKRNIMEYPLVKAIMAEFKGAKIETATRRITETDDDEEIDFGSDNN
uniref:DNA polymerase III subunit gamma/tau n=1 Tax=Candidatus Scatocola faecipullorum TaxID=2840917 RepID=UPI00402A3479